MTKPRTYFEALQWAFLVLKAQQIDSDGARFVLQTRQQWSHTQLVLHYQQAISEAVWQQFQSDVARLLKNEPPQYIVGQAPFYGHFFKVTAATLIPRPETEELVEWLLQTLSTQAELRVLDLGTGTGAIGISLKLARPQWQVTLSDISARALKVAQENASQLNAEVQLQQSDLFDKITEQFDVIISNPPYISETEQNVMDASVLLFEPKQALFAKQSGLAFYQRLAAELPQHLAQPGWLFLEHGYRQAPALRQLFEKKQPRLNLNFKKDLAGQPRMLRGQW